MKKGMIWPVLLCVCIIVVSLYLVDWGYTAPDYEELSVGLRLSFKIVGGLCATLTAFTLGSFIAESRMYDDEETDEA